MKIGLGGKILCKFPDFSHFGLGCTLKSEIRISDIEFLKVVLYNNAPKLMKTGPGGKFLCKTPAFSHFGSGVP